MKKLQTLNPMIKAVLIVLLFGLSIYGIPSPMPAFGYLSLFASLVVLFEGFDLKLFWKILIALALGVVIATSGLIEAENLRVIKPVGSKIFMNLLTMALVPLVFSSILTGVTSLGDIRKLERIGLRTIVYYVATTAIAITIGLALANLVQPGKQLPHDLKYQFEQSYQSQADSKVATAQQNKKTMFETLQSIVPKNILTSASLEKPEMLALIFFAVMCGIALLQLEPKHSEPIIKFFTGITELTVRLIMMVMRIAPYGIFAIIAAIIAETESLDLLVALIPFSLIVIIGLLIHGIGTNSLSLKFLSKMPVLKTFGKARSVVLTAFSTSSSGATMPYTLEVAEKRLGVRNDVAGFVIPLGATINMDGTALFQGASAIFLANIYNIDLSLIDQLTIVGMAVMASVGTAAVPGVGIVILTMILVSVGIPPEGILFILPVNNLLDMFRTAVNVMGDLTCSIFINASEFKKSETTT